MLAVNCDNDPKEKLERFRNKKGLAQRILLHGDGVAMESYSVRRFPTKYLVDRNGNITKRAYGNRGHDEFEEEIRTLLKARTSRSSTR